MAQEKCERDRRSWESSVDPSWLELVDPRERGAPWSSAAGRILGYSRLRCRCLLLSHLLADHSTQADGKSSTASAATPRPPLSAGWGGGWVAGTPGTPMQIVTSASEGRRNTKQSSANSITGQWTNSTAWVETCSQLKSWPADHMEGQLRFWVNSWWFSSIS